MKRMTVIYALLCLLCSNAWADGVLDSFTAKASKSYVTFNYSFVSKGEFTVTGSGRGEIYGNSYHFTGDGMEIWSDGSSRWIIDTYGKEVIIESASGSNDDFIVDPSVFMADISNQFNIVSSGKAQFKGVDFHRVVLVPKKSSSTKEIRLFFSSSILKWVQVSWGNGTLNEFEIDNLEFGGSGKELKFDVKSLDKSWVVTDFRN